MSFKPDYGIRLLKDAVSSTVDHRFYDFRLYSLSVIARGQYSTMVDLPYDGQVYALSLDFSESHLDEILAKASPELRLHIRAQLLADPATPRTIDFEGEVSFGVRARLGALQKVQRESFVPLVAQEIF